MYAYKIFSFSSTLSTRDAMVINSCQTPSAPSSTREAPQRELPNETQRMTLDSRRVVVHVFSPGHCTSRFTSVEERAV